MKNIYKIVCLIGILLITSCSASKKAANNIIRDGSSFEKAIIANSISEEYAYVKKVCPDCKRQMQRLVFEKKKPYDLLDFKKANGETVTYYFDISKFFGKGF